VTPILYNEEGNHTVKIIGNFPAIQMRDIPWHMTDEEKINAKQLQKVTQWGDIQWKSMRYAFNYCTNFELNATDTPYLSNVTDMGFMFAEADAFNQDISSWDVSNVTDMRYMFYNANSFNQDISSWDVSNVTDMYAIFGLALAFNQDVSSWDVSNVTDMNYMFAGAESFNQDISSWNVSNVTNMSYMFAGAELFNQDLSSWDVSNVTEHTNFMINSSDGNIEPHW